MKKTALLLTSLLSASAFAQETPPPPPPPAPIATAPADAPVAEDPGGRVRWGLSANIGWHFPASAFAAGLEGHIGWQFSRMFSLYAVVGTNFGVGFSVSTKANGGSGGVTAFGAYYGGAIAELMLADMFYVGAGPLIGSGGYAGVEVAADSSGNEQLKVLAQSGLNFGIDGRLGINFGKPKGDSHRRGGFNLGIDVQTVFRPNTAVVTQTAQPNPNGGAPTFGVGVSTNEVTASVMPFLTLGYDAR